MTKWNSLSFPRFPDPLNSFFPYNYNVKTRSNEPPYQPFRYLSCSNAELKNIFLRSMVTGSTHASQRVTQPIYATVTKNHHAHTLTCRLVVGFRLRHRDIPSDSQKFPDYISNFPDFSRIKKNPWVFQFFQSCKDPVISSNPLSWLWEESQNVSINDPQTNYPTWVGNEPWLLMADKQKSLMVAQSQTQLKSIK